jgi:hypothetical protein
MPLTIENAGPLVAGGGSPSAANQENAMQQQQKPALPATLKVKVVRPFYYQGKPIEKDAIVDLPSVFALEMKAAHKAVLVPAEIPAAPAAQASASKTDAGKEKK